MLVWLRCAAHKPVVGLLRSTGILPVIPFERKKGYGLNMSELIVVGHLFRTIKPGTSPFAPFLV
jgi:hypothetical protein